MRVPAFVQGRWGRLLCLLGLGLLQFAGGIQVRAATIEETVKTLEELPFEEVAELGAKKELRIDADPLPESVQKLDAAFERRLQALLEATQRQENFLRSLDRDSLQHAHTARRFSAERYYLDMLRREEFNASLTALFHYKRYHVESLEKALQGKAVLPVDALSHYPGLRQKADDLENVFHASIGIETSYSAQEVRDVFSFRRRQWLKQLANHSEILVELDKEISSLRGQGEDASLLEEEKQKILLQEPLLNIRVPSPFAGRDRRPVYFFLYDLYFAIPDKDLFCGEFEEKAVEPCQILEELGMGRSQLYSLRMQILEEHYATQELADRVMYRFMERARGLLEAGEKSFQPTELREGFEEFPGGLERFRFIEAQWRSETEDLEEIAQYVLSERVRDELALAIVDPALNDVVQQFEDSIHQISGHGFVEYLQLPNLRQVVLVSLLQSSSQRFTVEDLEDLDERVMGRASQKAQIRRIAEFMADGLLLISFVISPPSMAITVPVGAARFTITGVHVLTLTRGLIATAYSVAVIQNASRNLEVAKLRILSGLGSYESLSIAQSQFQGVVLRAYLRIFGSLRYAGQLHRMTRGTWNQIRNSPKTLQVLAKELRTFARNPLGETKRILRIAWSKKSEPAYVMLQSTRTLGTISKKIIHTNRRAFRRLWQMRRLPPGRFFQRLKHLPLGKAALNAGTSTVVMAAAEVVSRGTLDVWNDPGAYRNIIITIFIDSAIAFYGLGSFTALEQTIAIGGTVFAASMIGQVMTNIEVMDSLPRAFGEAAYVTTLSPWKLRVFDNLQEKLTRAPTGTGFFVGSYRFLLPGLVYTINNGIGNYIYSKGTIHLFETNEPIEGSPWWPRYVNQNEESGLRVSVNRSGARRDPLPWWRGPSGRDWVEETYVRLGR